MDISVRSRGDHFAIAESFVLVRCVFSLGARWARKQPNREPNHGIFVSWHTRFRPRGPRDVSATVAARHGRTGAGYNKIRLTNIQYAEAERTEPPTTAKHSLPQHLCSPRYESHLLTRCFGSSPRTAGSVGRKGLSARDRRSGRAARLRAFPKYPGRQGIRVRVIRHNEGAFEANCHQKYNFTI